MNTSSTTHGSSTPVRKFPPISEISVAILALVIVGGIYMASHLPNPVSLAPAVTLTTIAAILLVINIVLLSRIKNFAWKTFFLVAKWSLLAYLIIAGILEYVFINDGTRGSVLALMSSTLVIFAINIPILFGFTVAHFQDE